MKTYISNSQRAFTAAKAEFKDGARQLLSKLRLAISLFKQHTKFIIELIDKKFKEAPILEATVASLRTEVFEYHLTACAAK